MLRLKTFFFLHKKLIVAAMSGFELSFAQCHDAWRGVVTLRKAASGRVFPSPACAVVSDRKAGSHAVDTSSPP